MALRMTPPPGTSRRKRRSKHTEEITPDSVTAAFIVCPRCSFFLSGYKLIHTDFTDSVSHSTSGWLELTWDHDTSQLVYKTYGYRFDRDIVHYEGVCPECRRVFVYKQGEGADAKTTLSIEIVPG